MREKSSAVFPSRPAYIEDTARKGSFVPFALMARNRGLCHFWPFHQQNKRDDNREYERQEAEKLNEGNHDSLLLHHSSQSCICGICGGGEIHTFGHEAGANLIEYHANTHIETGQMRSEDVELRLCVPAQRRCNYRNSHASTQVSHETEEASRVSHFFLLNQAHGDRCQRNEYQSHRN